MRLTGEVHPPQNEPDYFAMPGKERGWFLMQARNWMFGLLASLFTLTAPLAANAADPVALSNGPGKTYLVAVGIGEFKDKAIHPRPTADTDAKALYKLLTDSKVLGVSPDRAKLLTSADATKESVVKAIESAITETGKDDLIILAFFGRGSAVAEKPCFFTPESTFKDRAKTALTTTDLEPAFKKLKGQKLLWLMDVSYKGVDAGKEKVLEPTIAEYLKLAFDDADRDDNALPVNRVLVFGNLPFREALTKGEHGLFYSVLADALAGKADEKPFNTGYESDGLVTIYELAKYLEKEIPNGAREVGKTDREKELIPFVMGQATSRYWVTRNPAVTESVAERLKKLEALEKAGKLSEDDAKEGAGLLFRMPKLNWTQELRKAYQQLADGKIAPEALLATRKTLKEGLSSSEGGCRDVRHESDGMGERTERPVHQDRDGRRADRCGHSRPLHSRRGVAPRRHRGRPQGRQGVDPRTPHRTADRGAATARQARGPRWRQGR